MHTYFLFGSYTAMSIQEINSERTCKATKIVQDLGGKVLAMYALMGEDDIVMIVALASNMDAVKATVHLAQETGLIFKSAPAVSVDRFDEFLSTVHLEDVPEVEDLLDETMSD